MRAGILPSMQAKLPGRKASGRRFVNWGGTYWTWRKAIEDRALMDFLAEQQIGIESCLTSNIQTSTVAELAAHPLKTFLEHGIRASINTDDPAYRSGYHSRIYRCRAGCWVIREQIRRAQINGLEMAFLSAEENAHCEKSRCEVTKWMVLIAPSSFTQGTASRDVWRIRCPAQSTPLPDCLTCRNRIFTIAI